jgi:hypothetical protein
MFRGIDIRSFEEPRQARDTSKGKNLKHLKAIGATIALAMAMVLGIGAPANAAVGTPSNAHVSFTKSFATVGWSAAPGATSYTVIVSKEGYLGPYQGFTTSSTSIQISFANFPYKDATASPYRFQISATGGGSTSTLQAFNPEGGGVSTSNKNAAGQKVADCLKQGSAAGLVTAGGVGLTALAAIWVPAVGQVSAAGAAVAIAGAAAGTYIICLLN